jgi:hypothetical protein
MLLGRKKQKKKKKKMSHKPDEPTIETLAELFENANVSN